MPPLYTNGMVVVGDAACLVDSMHREGSNLAVTSGLCAAQAIIRAMEWQDFSSRSLARYEQLLRDSYVIRDLQKYRRAPHFFESRRDIFRAYPEIARRAAEIMLTVDGVSKRQKQWQIVWEALGLRRPWNMLRDAWEALISFP
jgi:electron transfer flavoprotein-quinone oxidoreductase